MKQHACDTVCRLQKAGRERFNRRSSRISSTVGPQSGERLCWQTCTVPSLVKLDSIMPMPPPRPAGVEVGQYAGFVAALRLLQRTQPDSIPARIERNLAAMEECLLQYPLYDPTVRRGGTVWGQRGGVMVRAAMLAARKREQKSAFMPHMHAWGAFAAMEVCLLKYLLYGPTVRGVPLGERHVACGDACCVQECMLHGHGCVHVGTLSLTV